MYVDAWWIERDTQLSYTEFMYTSSQSSTCIPAASSSRDFPVMCPTYRKDTNSKDCWKNSVRICVKK